MSLLSRLQHKDSLMDWDILMDCQGAHGRKEGQEDQGILKQLGGYPLALLPQPGTPGLRSCFGLPGNQPSYSKPASYPFVEACFRGILRAFQLFYRNTRQCFNI